jgi:hypothetical protein
LAQEAVRLPGVRQVVNEIEVIDQPHRRAVVE